MSRPLVSVPMDATLEHVRTLLEAHHIHHVVVVENGRLMGIISDRDLLRHLSPFLGHEFNERGQDLNTLSRRAHQSMTRKVKTATAETDVTDAAMLMLRHRVGCLPVTDENGRLRGIVTWRDMVRYAFNLDIDLFDLSTPDDDADDEADDAADNGSSDNEDGGGDLRRAS